MLKTNKKGQIIACDLQNLAVSNTSDYLTIISRARVASESKAHEAEGRISYSLRGHEGERNNCFIKSS